MRIYFDMCCLQRPLDDQSQLRIRLESQAIVEILAACEAGKVALASSEALLYENAANPHAQRRQYAANLLRLALQVAVVDREVLQQARSYRARGIKPMDALHLALAGAARVDYFCSCDDALLAKARRLTRLPLKIVSPLELVAELLP